MPVLAIDSATNSILDSPPRVKRMTHDLPRYDKIIIRSLGGGFLPSITDSPKYVRRESTKTPSELPLKDLVETINWMKEHLKTLSFSTEKNIFILSSLKEAAEAVNLDASDFRDKVFAQRRALERFSSLLECEFPNLKESYPNFALYLFAQAKAKRIQDLLSKQTDWLATVPLDPEVLDDSRFLIKRLIQFGLK